MTSLELTRPDDWHLHLRDGEMLRAVLPYTSAIFGRAIIMPNLTPPVRTVSEAQAYRRRILAALPSGHSFEPLMTCYLTDDTDADALASGFLAGEFVAAKLYPAGATTNSDSGVSDVKKIHGVLAKMAQIGMPLLVHGEVTDADVDVFDREAVFIDRVLAPLHRRFPELKVVFEHVTTAEAVAFVEACERNMAATITTHHLMINRNAMFKGGLRPHYYCLPVAKRERHRTALRAAATGRSPRFFLGTDSAPHAIHTKETDCGCAGLFTSVNAIACLAHVFEEDGALDALEGFASLHGPAFYGLTPNVERIRLVKQDAPVGFPGQIATEIGAVLVFDPEHPLYWQVMDT
jgi:dihydroorotase